MGSIGILIGIVVIAAGVIGFAYHARQQAEQWNQQQVSAQAALPELTREQYPYPPTIPAVLTETMTFPLDYALDQIAESVLPGHRKTLLEYLERAVGHATVAVREGRPVEWAELAATALTAGGVKNPSESVTTRTINIIRNAVATDRLARKFSKAYLAALDAGKSEGEAMIAGSSAEMD